MSDRTRSEDSQAQIEERLVDAEVRMEKSVESLHKELGGIRTGRATPSLVDRLQVDYYGAADPAAEHRRDHRPRGAAAAHPAVRPQLHRRHREGAAEERARPQPEQRRPGHPHRHPASSPRTAAASSSSSSSSKAEEARIAVRNIRRDEVDHLRKLEKEGHVCKDEIERNIAEVQHITDGFIGQS